MHGSNQPYAGILERERGREGERERGREGGGEDRGREGEGENVAVGVRATADLVPPTNLTLSALSVFMWTHYFSTQNLKTNLVRPPRLPLLHQP